MEDEVYTLHGGVDRAEFFDREREGAFEKFLIEIFDHRLFPLEVVDFAHVGAHRFVEVGKHSEVLVHGFRFEQVDHQLHRRGDGVVAHKLVVGKEGFKDRARDEVLRQHLDALFGSDARIEVVAEGDDKFVELGGVFSPIACDKARNAGDVFLGNFSHFGSPVFPIKAVATFLHEFGKDALLGGTKLKGELVGNLLVGDFLRIVAVVGVATERTATDTGLSESRQPDSDLRPLVFVERDGVDVGIEVVVVGTEGIEDGPHHGERVVVVEGFFGGGAFWHDDGDDDVAIFFLVGLSTTEGAHHASHALHHIHLRIAGREEEHGIEGRHVDTLRETAHIGDDATFLWVGGVFCQPRQGVVALGCPHTAIHVARLDVHHAFALFVGETLVVEGRDAGQHVLNVARGARFVGFANFVGEGQGSAHKSWVGLPSDAFVAHNLFGESVDYANEASRVVVVEFFGLEVFHLLHQGVGNHIFRHGEHQDFVVGEDAVSHGIGEIDAEKFLSIGFLIVHRTEHTIVFAGSDSGIFSIKARSGRHIESLSATDEVIIVNLDEVALVLLSYFDSRGAVGFVADHKVESAKLAVGLLQKEGLRGGDDLDALIGGKDHGEPLVGATGVKLSDNGIDVGGSRQREVHGGVVEFVARIATFDFARSSAVRTDADGFDGRFGISHPVVERLSQEGDAGHEEEHQAFALEFLFDEFERGESFARATRHNEFTAVVVLEVQMCCFEGFSLMRSELLFSSQSRLSF